MFEFFKKKKRARLSDTGDWSEFGFSSPTFTGQTVTEQSALSLPAVFACVRVLAESVGSLPLITYLRKPDGTKDRARQHPLYRILHDAPNPLMDSVSFFEMMVGHCALRGNAYARIDRDAGGDVVALWPMLPQNVAVEVRDGMILYRYQMDTQEIVLKPADVLHIKGLTLDGIKGVSPLTLLRETIGRAQAVNEYSGRFFSNDASPGGVIKHPAALGAEAHDHLKKSYDKAFKGTSNSHKVLILEEGMSFEAIGLSPEDSQMIDSQKFSVVDIARAFRVPLNLIQDHERSTYSNVTEQNRSFVVHTLVPWLTRIEQACNRVLLTEQERETYYVEHKLDNLLRGDQKTRYECYEIGLKNGFLSRNDVRGFENLSPMPGGDVVATGE
ncbi:MAG: phage portal protein [Desulfamplus sp.]|nr:phage portal protein [Desulfamplus sp.]